MIRDNAKEGVFFISPNELEALKQIPSFSPQDDANPPILKGVIGNLQGIPVIMSEAIPEPTETTASKLQRASQLLEKADHQEKRKKQDDLRDLLESPKMSTLLYQNFKQKFSELCQIKKSFKRRKH